MNWNIKLCPSFNCVVVNVEIMLKDLNVVFILRYIVQFLQYISATGNGRDPKHDVTSTILVDLMF